MRNSFVTNIQKVIMPKLFVSRWSVGVCVPVSKTSKNEKRKKNYAGVSIKELFEIDFFPPFHFVREWARTSSSSVCKKKKKNGFYGLTSGKLEGIWVRNWRGERWG